MYIKNLSAAARGRAETCRRVGPCPSACGRVNTAHADGHLNPWCLSMGVGVGVCVCTPS